MHVEPLDSIGDLIVAMLEETDRRGHEFTQPLDLVIAILRTAEVGSIGRRGPGHAGTQRNERAAHHARQTGRSREVTLAPSVRTVIDSFASSEQRRSASRRDVLRVLFDAIVQAEPTVVDELRHDTGLTIADVHEALRKAG